MNLLYFLAGALACFLAFALPSVRLKKRVTSRPWSAISNLRFEWNFDYKFDAERSTERIVADLAYLMQQQMQAERSEELRRVVVKPGEYTVRMNIDCGFVRRDEVSPRRP